MIGIFVAYCVVTALISYVTAFVADRDWETLWPNIFSKSTSFDR